MAFKFVTLFALISAATAAPGLVAGPAYTHGSYSVAAPAYVSSVAAAPAYIKTVAAAPALVKTVQYEAPAQYDFSYGVSDSLTGDHKSQAESRQGDNVHGSYSLIDSDGYKRTVDYTADEHNGFNAVVRREPLGHAVAAAPVAKVVAPVAQYAPATYNAQYAPAAYTAQYAPVAKVAYQAAPVAYAAAPVTRVVSPVVASAHYGPQLVTGAYAAPAAHVYHH